MLLNLTFIPFIDIPECDTNNGDCHHMCSETPGSFMCSCYNGYEWERLQDVEVSGESGGSEEGLYDLNTNAGRNCRGM